MVMALFNTQLANGFVMTTTCRRVRATVDGQAFWFAIHQFPGKVPQSISHIASSMHISDLPTGAAFAQRVGPARMRETLEAAERAPRSCAGAPHGIRPRG